MIIFVEERVNQCSIESPNKHESICLSVLYLYTCIVKDVTYDNPNIFLVLIANMQTVRTVS